VRRILPPLLNDFVALQKDSALVGFIGLAEILTIANIDKNTYFNLSPVTGAAICFLVVTIPFTRLVDYLIKRDKARTQAN
jgi:polar amino acid transport system permease protein